MQLGDKAVSTLGNRLNVFEAIRTIAQHLPQIENVTRQIALFDKNTRPDFLQQFFFINDVACPFNKDEEGFEVLRWKRYRLAIAQQSSFCAVETVRAEGV